MPFRAESSSNEFERIQPENLVTARHTIERHPATGAFLFVGVGQDVKPQQPNNHVGVTPYKNVFERMVQKYDKKTVGRYGTDEGTG